MKKLGYIVAGVVILGVIGNAIDDTPKTTETNVASVQASAKEVAFDENKYTVMSVCKQVVKESATYPSKVDWDWGTSSHNTYENWDSKSETPHRLLYNTSGEWMNGFGNMVPFTMTCKADFSSDYWQIDELFINNQLVYKK